MLSACFYNNLTCYLTRAESYDQGEQMALCPALVSTMHTGLTTGVSRELHKCITTLRISAMLVLLPTLEIATIDKAMNGNTGKVKPNCKYDPTLHNMRGLQGLF